VFSDQPPLGSTKPDQISDGPGSRVLCLEASEFPIEYVSENILRIDQVLARHQLILPRVVGQVEARAVVETGSPAAKVNKGNRCPQPRQTYRLLCEPSRSPALG
jgi:hypothetical protein